VVVSAAVPETNLEVQAARAAGVEVIKNAELLRRIGANRTTLAIAGTHGKTTTTSMLAHMLVALGEDPTFVVGGVVRNLRRSGKAGKGRWFAVEADEYDRRFLSLTPWAAIITNMEMDHIDYFGSAAAMEQAFRDFAASVNPQGVVVLCADDPGASSLKTATICSHVIEYGIENGGWRATAVSLTEDHTAFRLEHAGAAVATCRLLVPGRHNVLNATACLALIAAMGLDVPRAAEALGTFRGAGRRFDLIGQAGGVDVLTDYGHLPAEVRATLQAASQRYPHRRLQVAFQPHTYARTALLMDEFVTALRPAAPLRIVGAYVPPGREQLSHDAETRELANRLAVPYIAGRAALVNDLLPTLQPDDVVVLMGAGDIYLAAEPLLDALRNRP
jgi:UDP-N-acetylmuramate--alanine ligase